MVSLCGLLPQYIRRNMMMLKYGKVQNLSLEISGTFEPELVDIF